MLILFLGGLSRSIILLAGYFVCGEMNVNRLDSVGVDGSPGLFWPGLLCPKRADPCTPVLRSVRSTSQFSLLPATFTVQSMYQGTSTITHPIDQITSHIHHSHHLTTSPGEGTLSCRVVGRWQLAALLCPVLPAGAFPRSGMDMRHGSVEISMDPSSYCYFVHILRTSRAGLERRCLLWGAARTPYEVGPRSPVRSTCGMELYSLCCACLRCALK